MTITDIAIGLAISACAAYAGFYSAARSRRLFDGLYFLSPVLGFAHQCLLGVSVMAFVGISLSIVRLRYGFAPDGADPNFPGELFGVSVWTVFALICVVLCAFGGTVTKLTRK